MNKAKFKNDVVKLATVEEARNRYRLGRKTLLDIAQESGALRKIGKLVRIDITILDKAIENYC